MSKSKLTFKPDAIGKLLAEPAVRADLERRARAVADAANASSSWGGYFSGPASGGERPRARVWNIKSGASDDESRNNRLIRALDAGR